MNAILALLDTIDLHKRQHQQPVRIILTIQFLDQHQILLELLAIQGIFQKLDQAFAPLAPVDMNAQLEHLFYAQLELMRMKGKDLALHAIKDIYAMLDQQHQLLLKTSARRDLIVRLLEAQHYRLNVQKANME